MSQKTSYRKQKSRAFACGNVGFLAVFAVVLLTVMPCGARPQDKPQTQPAPTQDTPQSKPAPRVPPAQRPLSKSVAEAPPLVADPVALDLGFLAPNTPGEGTVTIKNTGTLPVTINAVVASCKCTTINDLVGKIIAPSGSETITIKLDGAPAMGVRRSSVKVTVDGFARALDIAVKGEVSLPVRVVPPYINAIEQKNLTGRLIIESLDRKPFRILSEKGGGGFSIQGFDGATEAPRSSYVVSYDLSASAKDLPSHLLFETDAVGAGVVDVRVRSERAPKKPAIQFSDVRCNLGLIPAKSSKEALFTIANGTRVVESVTTTSSEATIALARTEPGNDGARNVFITVTPAAEFAGILVLPIVLKTATHRAELEVIASVRP